MNEEFEQNFQHWLSEMDNYLSEFIDFFRNENNIDLDFSPESLDFVEKWILENFKSKEIILKAENMNILNMLAIYIGETFRRNIGGRWKLDLSDEKSVFYKLPILTESPKIDVPICPHALTTTSISRNKGTFLSKILLKKL